MGGLDTIGAFNASGEVDDIASNSVALGTDTTGNYVATVAAGGGITVSGSGSETAAVTVAHSDTSSQGDVNNSGTTVIQDITLDTYGHITAIGSTTISTGGGNNSTSTTAVGAYAMMASTNPTNQNTGTGTSFAGNTNVYQYGGVSAGVNNYTFNPGNTTEFPRNGNIPSGTWHFRAAGGQNTGRCVLVQRTA